MHDAALDGAATWLAEYLHEMTVFPRGKHDDQVDSTAQFLDWLKMELGDIRGHPEKGKPASHRRLVGRHRRDVSGGCRVFDPCWLDQARRLKLRRHSSTPPDAASQVPKLCEPPVGSAPRETSGTEGSNPSPSSGESTANLTSRMPDPGSRTKRITDVHSARIPYSGS